MYGISNPNVGEYPQFPTEFSKIKHRRNILMFILLLLLLDTRKFFGHDASGSITEKYCKTV